MNLQPDAGHLAALHVTFSWGKGVMHLLLLLNVGKPCSAGPDRWRTSALALGQFQTIELQLWTVPAAV